MWSTSPAERTVMVPPRLTAVAPPLRAATAAAAAIPATASASTRTVSRWRPIVRVNEGDIAPPSRGSGCLWVEGVADPVAEQVEGEHGEQEGDAGEDEEPPGGGEDRCRL